MDILESLENLPVSEACFEDIVQLVEEIIQEESKGIIPLKKEYRGKMMNAWVRSRNREAAEASNNYERALRNLRNFKKAQQRGDIKVGSQVSNVQRAAEQARVKFDSKRQTQQSAAEKGMNRVKVPQTPQEKEMAAKNKKEKK